MFVFLFDFFALSTLVTFFTYPVVVSSITSLILPSFFWDPRNQIFNKSGCKSSWKYPHLYIDQESKMFIVCPFFRITHVIRNDYVPVSNLFENMYICNKEEFDTCKLGKDTDVTRLVMNCNEPEVKLKYKVLTFSRLITSRDDFEFKSGETYYFIATSNGTKESLDNRSKGRCESHNMKLAITICPYGSNCHSKSNWTCEREDKDKNADTKRTEKDVPYRPHVNTSITDNEKDVVRTDDTFTGRQVSNKDNASFCEDKLCLLYIGVAAIIGIIIGVTLAILTVKIMRSRNYTPSFKLMCYKRSKQSLTQSQEV